MSAHKKLVRKKFRDSVLKRDRNRCVLCKNAENIDVHHITDRTLMPGGGYVRENGISLCQEHLELAEIHLHNEEGAGTEAVNPTQLYSKIGSSYTKALEASKRLERLG